LSSERKEAVRKRRQIHSALFMALAVGAACSTPLPGERTPDATPGGRTTDASPVAATSQASAAAPATVAGPFPLGPTALGTVPAAAPVGSFCLDKQPPAVVGTLKTALVTRDGLLLASVVDPIHGMDAQLLRDGTVVNYDQAHAKYLFESDYAVDWGPAPGSGRQVKGSFRELFVPALLDVLTKDYSLRCDTLQVGGASYAPIWPYPAIDFYSVYFPGTQANGGLDWHTWALGMQIVGDKAYLSAITQYRWEP
jgi:hypothetical protein